MKNKTRDPQPQNQPQERPQADKAQGGDELAAKLRQAADRLEAEGAAPQKQAALGDGSFLRRLLETVLAEFLKDQPTE